MQNPAVDELAVLAADLDAENADAKRAHAKLAKATKSAPKPAKSAKVAVVVPVAAVAKPRGISDDVRDAMRARHTSGLSRSEVATEFNLPLKAVRRLLHLNTAGEYATPDWLVKQAEKKAAARSGA